MPYAISAPGVAPAAGKMPTKKPSSEPIQAGFHSFKTSFRWETVREAETSTLDIIGFPRVESMVQSISPIP